MKAGIYARVSTEEQKEGKTIDSQIEELRKSAQAQGLSIVSEYVDEGWSGGLIARPELDRLRDDCRDGKLDVVLCLAPDRLSRVNFHLGIIVNELKARSVKVIFKDNPLEETPEGNLLLNMLGSIAEFEREIIAERTRRGRRYKAEVRKIIVGNIPPYGYRYIKKDRDLNKEGYYQIVPEEAKIVRLIFNWFVKDQLSMRAIVRKLTGMAAKPRQGADKWAKSTVARILSNETYTCTTYYNKNLSFEPSENPNGKVYRRTKKTGRRLRPKSDWIPIKLPESLRIIDNETFGLAQLQLERNKQFSPRNTKKNDYLLQGLLKCGACESPYVGEPIHQKLFYRCGNRHKTFPLPRTCMVKPRMISAGIVEPAVWESLSEAIQNPKIVIDQLKKRQGKASSLVENQSNAISKELARLTKQEDRWLELFGDGFFNKEQIRQKLTDLQDKKVALNKQKEELIKSCQGKPIFKVRDLRTIFGELKKKLANLDFENKRKLVRLLVDKIVINNRTLTIYSVVPQVQMGLCPQPVKSMDANQPIRFVIIKKLPKRINQYV